MIQRLLQSTFFCVVWFALASSVPPALGSTTNFQLFVIATSSVTSGEVWHYAVSGTNSTNNRRIRNPHA